MKALVSRPPANSQLAISHIRSLRKAARGDDSALAHARRLSEAISELSLDPDSNSQISRLSALNSPCFYHKRFDDAVDIERVLAELEDDGYLSHSRLMQTATGVREVSRQLQRKSVKQAVRNIMIVTKARDNDLVLLTRQLAKWLISTPRYGSTAGVTVYVDAKLKNSKRFDAPSLISQDPRFATKLKYWTPELCWSHPEVFDLVITLGGDGTVLYTSWLFQRIVPAVLSFSLGSLGFLTNFEFTNYKPTLDAIMGESGMRVNLRMRFTCTVYRADPSTPSAPVTEAEQFEVLNEVVIDRGPSPYVSNLEIYGDNHLLTIAQADGVIFSTPTGSTAYSLSAGGSLVHPDIPAILLTPICPHTLSFRPMLLRDSMALRVAIPRASRATAYVAFDGKGRVELREGDYVTIAASQYPFPTVLSREMEWIDSISRTLRWNTRGATQKGWSRGEFNLESGPEEQEREEEFDIDFEDDEARDSGYSGEGSSAGSPLGRKWI
jgi:NAD+ kinase